MKMINYLKAGFTALLAVYGIILTQDVTTHRFLDRVDLIAHEAGHMLFSWFGEFIMVIGGTLGQLLVPVGIMVYFYLRQELYSSSVMLFWVGQNLFNISVYVKDAQTMALPLVSIGGGEDTIHDWNYLLSRFGLLRWDQTVGSLAYILGLLTIAASVVVGFYLSVQKKET
jgi:hypothetical protein